jgi:hypothetical protein
LVLMLIVLTPATFTFVVTACLLPYPGFGIIFRYPSNVAVSRRPPHRR